MLMVDDDDNDLPSEVYRKTLKDFDTHFVVMEISGSQMDITNNLEIF